MTDSSTQNTPKDARNNHQNSTRNELAQLRSLLFGFEESELEKLHKQLENARINAEELSRVLPEAVILQSLQEKQLAEALLPTVEEAIQLSVKRDVNILSDAIFPIIGPASRKAIATALETTIESINQVVEHSFSPQSIKWRLEAKQTGKSFAEIVLLRTLVYRVEQVFLIHRKTGLLLQHLVGKGVATQDADLVSAMLTAIQDFVRDSFSVQPGDALETLQFGELTIWIEHGPQAILAGIIRGNAPKEVRLVFQNAIEKIHLYQSDALKSYQGDAEIFSASKPYLQDCLQTQYQPKKHKISPITRILFATTLIALGSWSFFYIRDKLRWAIYVEKLNAEPGIVVTTAEKRYGKYFISGLRDPLAVDPILLMKEAKVNPSDVTSRWEPYLSFHSGFIAARAKELLQPPATVSLKVDENGVLYATGAAPHQWIVETRKLARVIPGVKKFQEENLFETELIELQSTIEKQILRFITGTKNLEPNQYKELQDLMINVKRITEFAKVFGKDVYIEMIGHTDAEGSEETNMRLSQARANAILSALTSRGIEKTHLSVIGVGTQQPLRQELNEEDRAYNRSVSFKVNLINVSPNREP